MRRLIDKFICVRCADSDKCIPEKWQCDQFKDCADASDEQDCDIAERIEESRTAQPTFSNARTFPFIQSLAPTSPSK